MDKKDKQYYREKISKRRIQNLGLGACNFMKGAREDLAEKAASKQHLEEGEGAKQVDILQ